MQKKRPDPYQNMRTHLRRVRDSGALEKNSGVDHAMSLALQSGEQEGIPTIFNLLQAQEDMFGIDQQEEEKACLWQEPSPANSKDR